MISEAFDNFVDKIQQIIQPGIIEPKGINHQTLFNEF